MRRYTLAEVAATLSMSLEDARALMERHRAPLLPRIGTMEEGYSGHVVEQVIRYREVMGRNAAGAKAEGERHD